MNTVIICLFYRMKYLQKPWTERKLAEKSLLIFFIVKVKKSASEQF